VTFFGATHTRGKQEMFGIRAVDRGKHIYVIGKTGMGKSTMLENMAIQDIQNGEGLAFIDPHGSTAEKLLDFVPYDRLDDVVYFAPFDTDYPVGFNVMEDVGYDKRHLVVSGLMGALKRIWVDAWSARMEYILQNTLLALLEYPGSTLLDVNRMLTNKTFRTAVIEKITDPRGRARRCRCA
jgi:energy-coupling factor transporter ATP-binding protein EcfA2